MTSLPTDKIISCFYGSSDDCVKVLDLENSLMSFNPNGLKVMEIDDEKSVIGKNWLTLWDATMKEKAQDALAIARSGKLARFEGYCPTFKGTMKYWEVSIAPLYNEFDQIQWLLVMSRDSTDLKNLEKQVVSQQRQITELEMQLKAVA